MIRNEWDGSYSWGAIFEGLISVAWMAILWGSFCIGACIGTYRIVHFLWRHLIH